MSQSEPHQEIECQEQHERHCEEQQNVTPVTNLLGIDIGIKNLAVCYLSIIHNPETPRLVIRHWQVHTLAESAKNLDLQEIGKVLYEEFDGIFAAPLPFPDHVIIENQPALKNPSMKSIQMLVYAYFVGQQAWQAWSGKIHLMSATEKLKGHGIRAEDYRGRKMAAIELTEQLIANSPSSLQTFRASKKKDDLADCFLYTIAFAKKLQVRSFSLT